MLIFKFKRFKESHFFFYRSVFFSRPFNPSTSKGTSCRAGQRARARYSRNSVKRLFELLLSAGLTALLRILRERSLSAGRRPCRVCNVSPASGLFPSLSRRSARRRGSEVLRRPRCRLINGAGWNFSDSSVHDFSRTRVIGWKRLSALSVTSRIAGL